MAAIGLVVLRLIVAAVFVVHGAHKLFGSFPGPGIGPGGLDETAAEFTRFGLHPAFTLAVVAGITQLLGGLLIGVGYFARWAAIANLIYIGVGVWAEHGKWGFFLNWLMTAGRGHGIEYSLVMAGALACIALGGAGDYSFDGRRSKSREYRAAGRA